jgi:hypothetical protein
MRLIASLRFAQKDRQLFGNKGGSLMSVPSGFRLLTFSIKRCHSERSDELHCLKPETYEYKTS